jgi:hypothetical protein
MKFDGEVVDVSRLRTVCQLIKEGLEIHKSREPFFLCLFLLFSSSSFPMLSFPWFRWPFQDQGAQLTTIREKRRNLFDVDHSAKVVLEEFGSEVLELDRDDLNRWCRRRV